jgi:hypothetical protein
MIPPLEPERPQGVSEADWEDGNQRMKYLQDLLGNVLALDETSPVWNRDMSFVYIMALFLCGRCLRPLANKVRTQTGEEF